MKEISFVDVKDSGLVDGTIVTEAKLGKEGIAIKLADKMKALEKLSLYFDLFPDQFKQKIENEKLKLAKQKAEKTDDSQEPIEIMIKRKSASHDCKGNQPTFRRLRVQLGADVPVSRRRLRLIQKLSYRIENRVKAAEGKTDGPCHPRGV